MLGGDPHQVYEQCFAVPVAKIIKDDLLRVNALFHKPLHANGAGSFHHFSISTREWQTRKLRDVVERIFYPGRFRREYVDESEEAVPFLGGSNITELIATRGKWLRLDDPKLEVLSVKPGWILVTRSGSTGIISCVPPAWDGYAMSEHVIRVVPDPRKLDPYYLLAFLRTDCAQEVIRRGVFGSVIDEITPECLGGLDVPIPRSKKILEEIARQIRDAEDARQRAIEGYEKALRKLGRLFALTN